jgi:hypothetical protein
MSELVSITFSALPLRLKVAVQTGRPLVVLGAPGVGKTQGVLETAADLGLGSVIFNAASALPFDLIGQPYVADGQSRLGEPTWLTEIRATGRPTGLLVVDEITTAPIEAAPAFAQLLGERRCGPHRLPDGWVVIGLGNEPNHRAGARPMLAHIVNRVAVVRLEPDIGAWVQWARRRGLPPAAIAFVRSGEFEPWLARMAPRGANEPWLSFRSLTLAVEDLIAANGFAPSADAADILAARIPAEVAGLLVEFLLVGQELPTWEQILADPGNAPVPSSVRAGLILAENVLGKVLTFAAKGKTALLAAAALTTYGQRLPGAIQALVAMPLLEARFRAEGAANPILVSEVFAKWAHSVAGSSRGSMGLLG